jgi:hypothetical protein
MHPTPLLAVPGAHKLAGMAPQIPRRPAPPSSKRGSDGRRVTSQEAGSYLGCPACGRFLKIEWAVRSVVCSCGARLPVTRPAGSRS